MDTNKGIKLLRIVSLTLGIISMLFFLYTKICHAQGTQITTETQMPLLYGEGIGYDSSQIEFNQGIINQINAIGASTDTNAYNKTKYTGYGFYTIGAIKSSYYEIIAHCFPNQSTGNPSWSTEEISGFTAIKFELVNMNYNSYANIYRVDLDGTNVRYYGDTNASVTIYPYDFANQNQAGIYVWTQNVYKRDYLLWVNPDYYANGIIPDLSGTYSALARPYFTQDIENQEQATITGIFEKTALIAGAGQDLASLPPATMQSWLQGIIDTIWASANNKVQNLTSFFGPNFSIVTGKLTGILQGIHDIITVLNTAVGNDLTAGGIQNAWITDYQQSDIYTLVNVGTGIKNSLSNLGQAEPQAPRIIVNLGQNTFFGSVPEFEFSWLWYESNRTIITTFITAFWLVGLGIHLATQIPNIIRGASGSAHGIQNAVQPIEVHKDIYH